MEKPLKHIFNNASTEELRSGAWGQDLIRKNKSVACTQIMLGAPGGNKLEPLGVATIIAHFLYDHNEPGLFTPQRFTQRELDQLRAQENYKV